MRASTFCSTKGHFSTFWKAFPQKQVSDDKPLDSLGHTSLLAQMCNMKVLKALNLIPTFVPPNPVQLSRSL